MATAEEIIATLKPEEKLVVINGKPLFIFEKAEGVIVAVQRYAAGRGLREWRCLDTQGRCTERMVVIGIEDTSRQVRYGQMCPRRKDFGRKDFGTLPVAPNQAHCALPRCAHAPEAGGQSAC